MVYTDRWAYAPIGADGSRELFALADDPYCETNVIEGQKAIADTLHAKLIAWMEQMDAPADAVDALRPA